MARWLLVALLPYGLLATLPVNANSMHPPMASQQVKLIKAIQKDFQRGRISAEDYTQWLGLIRRYPSFKSLVKALEYDPNKHLSNAMLVGTFIGWILLAIVSVFLYGAFSPLFLFGAGNMDPKEMCCMLVFTTFILGFMLVTEGGYKSGVGATLIFLSLGLVALFVLAITGHLPTKKTKPYNDLVAKKRLYVYLDHKGFLD